ncbi:hypothetical protein [Nostoc sp.]
MECGTIFKIAGVYNFAPAICGVVALRIVSENIKILVLKVRSQLLYMQM